MKRGLEKKRRLNARKLAIRRKVRGVAARPRVSVFFSNRSVTAQLIDDEAGKTLASVSTLEKGSQIKGKGVQTAKTAGETLAQKANAIGVTAAVFDRNGRKYHGRVKQFADAMREKGISM